MYGTNPKDFESWLEEIDRLSDVTGKTNIAVAIFTARGSLYNHIKKFQNNKHEWDVIKQKLLERFSEFGSAIMAKHKLNTIKQNDTPIHEYISKYTSLTRHAYNVGHFIKDCPLNQDHSQYHHSQNHHKGGY